MKKNEQKSYMNHWKNERKIGILRGKIYQKMPIFWKLKKSPNPLLWSFSLYKKLLFLKNEVFYKLMVIMTTLRIIMTTSIYI